MRPENLEKAALELESAIVQAAAEMISQLRVVERSKPWWNSELKEKRKELHRALCIYKKERSQEKLLRWKEIRNNYFQAIRKAKTTH
ncbi:MAG: hypothetical protein WDN66_02430 [Candidatus Saccharibacteria bacterium]